MVTVSPQRGVTAASRTENPSLGSPLLKGEVWLKCGRNFVLNQLFGRLFNTQRSSPVFSTRLSEFRQEGAVVVLPHCGRDTERPRFPKTCPRAPLRVFRERQERVCVCDAPMVPPGEEQSAEPMFRRP